MPRTPRTREEIELEAVLDIRDAVTLRRKDDSDEIDESWKVGGKND